MIFNESLYNNKIIIFKFLKVNIKNKLKRDVYMNDHGKYRNIRTERKTLNYMLFSSFK